MGGFAYLSPECEKIIQHALELDQEIERYKGSFIKSVNVIVDSFFTKTNNPLFPFIKLPCEYREIESRLSQKTRQFIDDYPEVVRIKVYYALFVFELEELLQHSKTTKITEFDNTPDCINMDLQRCKELAKSPFIIDMHREHLDQIAKWLSMQRDYFDSIHKNYIVNEAQLVIIRKYLTIYPELGKYPGLFRLEYTNEHSGMRGLPSRAALLRILFKLLYTGRHGNKGKTREAVAALYNEFFDFVGMPRLTSKDVENA